MILTRRLRRLLAGPRRELASVLTVMLLVLSVVSVHVLCDVHLEEQAQGAGHSHAAAVQDSGQESATAGAVLGAVPTPLGGESHGCSDHHSATVQCDPVVPSPQGPGVVPDLAGQRLVSERAYHEPAAWSSVVVAAAPSLTALGISRT